MNLTELKAAGGFIATAPVKRRVIWERNGQEPVEFDVHIKRLAFGALERLMMEDDDERSRSASFLSAAVLLGDAGDEPLTYEDAYQLDPSLATVLLKTVREVNATGDQPAKN